MSFFGDIVFSKVEGLMPYTSRVSRFVGRDFFLMIVRGGGVGCEVGCFENQG